MLVHITYERKTTNLTGVSYHRQTDQKLTSLANHISKAKSMLLQTGHIEFKWHVC